MDKKLIDEINRIKKLSNINESKLDEGFIDDLTDFVGSAWDKLTNNSVVRQIKKLLGVGDESEKKYTDDVMTPEKKSGFFSSYSTSTNDDDFYSDILKGIGAPVTKENMKFMYAWRQAEGGRASYNPFNTTKKFFGATLYGKNVAGVKNYSTPEDGVEATVKTLKNGHYNCIVDGLKNDIGAKRISTKCHSDLVTWGTHKRTDLITQVIDSYERGRKPSPHPIQKGTYT